MSFTLTSHAFINVYYSIFTAKLNKSKQTNDCIVLITSAKSGSTRGPSRYAAFMGNCMTISHTC